MLQVAFKPVTFHGSTILGLRVKGHLPFTEAAYRRWRVGRVCFGIAFVLGMVLVTSTPFLMEKAAPLAVPLFLLGATWFRTQEENAATPSA